MVTAMRQSPRCSPGEIGGEGYPKACPQQGALIVKIQRIGQAYAGQEMPIEIVVRREPPADDSAVPPAAAKQDGAAAPTHGGSPVAIAGGASFNDAPEIASGTTYTDTIVTGENRYFRIPLQWGQRFTYLLSPTGPAQPELFPGAIAWMDVFNPVRDGVSMTRFDTSGEIWFSNDPPDPFTASTPYPVRYTNREVGDSRGFSLDGDYYLRLSANLSDEEPSTTGYLLTVVVSGDPETGPVYQPSGFHSDQWVGDLERAEHVDPIERDKHGGDNKQFRTGNRGRDQRHRGNGRLFGQWSALGSARRRCGAGHWPLHLADHPAQTSGRYAT